MHITKIQTGSRPRTTLLSFAAVLLGSTALVPSAAHAGAQQACTSLAAQIQTAANPDITSATSVLVAAAGSNLAYCNVQLKYSHLAGPAAGYAPGQSQVIQIGIGLPLNAIDGGTGGVVGAWNGRIWDNGCGGTCGSVGSNTAGTNLGYVEANTDTGHSSTTNGGSGANFPLNGLVGSFSGGTFTAPLNPPNDNSFNWGIYTDFAYRGSHAMSQWSKIVTNLYYGQPQNFAYWNGCSEGGHQGMSQAMRFPAEHDGYLIGDPVMMYDRLQPMQFWGQVVAQTLMGSEVSNAKQTAVSNAAIASCQGNFGGTPDGIIQDPRACRYNAYQYVCGQVGANINGVPDTTNCLNTDEAEVINQVWVGVANDTGIGGGGVIYPGWSRGSDTTTQNGQNGPGSTNLDYAIDYVLQDPSFNWRDFTPLTFQQMIINSELKFSQLQGVADTNWKRFNQLGKKMLIYHGWADQNVPDRGTTNWYNKVVAADGSLATTQSYMRYFPFPGNQHCGGVKLQPNSPIINTTDMLNVLQVWVEGNIAPDSFTGYNNSNHAAATITRPICKYPDTLTYTGANGGNVFTAANFTCTHQSSDPLEAQFQMANDIGPGMTYGITATHDFNNDRSSDILFRDSGGNIAAWLMTGTSLSSAGNPSSILQSSMIGNVSTAWSIVGQRDLVGQGDSSVLWRDTAGDAAIWSMNGTNVSGVNLLSPVQTNWSVAATGSFTNNNTTQHTGGIIWQDTSNNLAVSVASNGQISSTYAIGQLPANWTVVAADLNGWVVLRNMSTGDVAIWQLQVGSAQCAFAEPPLVGGGSGSACNTTGVSVPIAAVLGNVPLSWTIAGLGDFDGDGISDIVWRDTSGNVAIWTLKTTPTSIGVGSSVLLGNVATNWQIAQIGDYNGDGYSDILWQDTNSGTYVGWFMQGTTVVKSQSYGTVPGTWKVQALND